MSGRAEQMRLVKALKKQGFDVVRTGSGHWKVTRPEKTGSVILPFSPSGRPQHKSLRLLKNLGYKP